MKNIHAVLMAGGKGTRLGGLTKELPKPMVEVANKPIIERQIDNLKRYGIKDITIVVGYLGDIIKDYFKDGKDFGVNIDYICEDTPLGSAGSLFYLKDKFDDDFFLLFADLIMDIDFERMMNFHKDKKALVTLFAHPNSHPFDSDLLITDNNDVVLKIDSKHNVRDYYYHNLVNAGLYVLSPSSLDILLEEKKLDMEKDFINAHLSSNRVYAYCSSEYVKDAGTPERLALVSDDINNRIVKAKNLSNPQKAIFLDRDGTINKGVGHLDDIDKFELLPNVSEAIKLINQSNYLAIVITNQPVIARGALSFEGLDEIHKKMETLLGKDGAYLDGIYFCPHHPDKGFDGERVELKFDCDCRKPKIGMLLKAKDKFNIDLTKSYFIGDGFRDVECGINGGCKTILLGKEDIDKCHPDVNADNLLDAVKLILKR